MVERYSSFSVRCLRCICAAALVLLLSRGAVAAKTDVVVLKNGDRLTGEVKKLEYGKLSFKTDDMGTVRIEWDNVAEVVAKEQFEVELEDGTVHFGSLDVSPFEDKIAVIFEGSTAELDRQLMIRITPIKDRFWARLDGLVSLGYNFTKASEISQFSFDSEISYRSRKSQSELSVNSVVTDAPDLDVTKRHDLSLRYTRFLKHRWFAAGFAGLQSSTELGLDLRLLAGAGGGRNLIQTNINRLVALSGLVVNREWSRGSDSTQYNLEAAVQLHFARFKYDDPETDISATISAFPNLTTSGRVRVEADTRLAWEMVNDLFLSLSAYASYDNEPLRAEAATHDWGTFVGIGWSF